MPTSLPAHVEVGLPSLHPGLKSPRPRPLDTPQLPSWRGLASPTRPEGSQLLGAPAARGPPLPSFLISQPSSLQGDGGRLLPLPPTTLKSYCTRGITQPGSFEGRGPEMDRPPEWRASQAQTRYLLGLAVSRGCA